ncbi:MAG: DUF952 domain-containing protein [Bacteroidetes bacterium]|nr:DUF952 domain-containing protein [Bacteroidota bacterium]
MYHITTPAAWATAQQSGEYTAPSLKDEGFIHCSQHSQLEGVRERFYKNAGELILLEIDTTKLTEQYIFEWAPSIQDTFPHIYGPINLDAVVTVKPF